MRKIPIGVFDPVYKNLSMDAMLDKVSALGLEAMEIGQLPVIVIRIERVASWGDLGS